MQRTARLSLWLAIPLALIIPVLSALAQPSGAARSAASAKNPMLLSFKKPDPARGKTLIQTCQGCHGPGLASVNEAIPGLAGQNPSYMRLQLAAFRAKLRPSPSKVMWQMAAPLSDQDIADIAAYAAAQKPGKAWTPESAALRAKGEKLFLAGDSKRNIIACAICHGTNGRGDDRLGVASITNLAPGYAVEILHEFKGAPGFGVPYPDAMRIALRPMTDADLKAVASYVSSMQK